MGLFFSEEASVDVRGLQEDALYHRMGCKACPLRNEPGRMPATGAEHPQILILGEAPGKDEIEEGRQFVGASGQLLRPNIPRRFLPLIRWNNTIRSRPPKNRTPERPEIESCRPSVQADIEQSKPQAIFGFGNVPLSWISNFTGILMWRGRRMPVKVGSHVCWYYPMLHPSFLLRNRRGKDRSIPSEEERMFRFDLKRAFAEVEAGLPEPEVHSPEQARAGVEIITAGGEVGLQQVAVALEWAAQQSAVGVDYETNCIRPYRDGSKILSAAVGTMERAIAFPFAHRQSQFNEAQQKQLDRLWIKFLRSKVKKYVHNLSFEMEWTAYFFGDELIWNNTWECSAVQASVIDQRKGKRTTTGGCFSLEFLVQQYFGFNLKKLAGVNRKDLDSEALPKVLTYNAMDAKYHLGLGKKQAAVIRAQNLQDVYVLSRRRIPTVVQAQLNGIPIDQKAVARLQAKYETRIKKTLAEIKGVPIVQTFQAQFKREYNPASNPDTLEIFHKMLKRQECEVVDKYSKKVKYSVDEEVLIKIKHPLAALLMKLRHDSKRKSTYLDPVALDAGEGQPGDALYSDGLVHINYNTYFPETGRLSADDVNVQNYPKREEEAKEVRQIVAALEKDTTILAFDYGQIQARIIAMFSKDKRFVKALWERYDIHQEWAERLARSYPDRIGGRKMLTDKKAMKDFRRDIKNQWTFPLFFGARLESAADYLKMPIEKVKPNYDEFWRQFAGVKAWQEELIQFYNQNGYVETLNGRRRYGPLSLNKIINSPVQGTEADIVMDGMCTLYETGDLELQPELMIHDDLTFLRIRKNRAEAVAEKVLNILLDVPFDYVNVPITIELSSGPNWLELKEVGAFSSDEWFAK